MYRAFATLNSRVPGTRPGRPRPGCSARIETASSTRLTTRCAAAVSSVAMYVASSSMLRSALRSHLTRIHFPLLGHCNHVLVAGKFTGIGFLHRRLDLADLPLVVLDVGTDGFGGKERLAALGCFGQYIEAVFDIVFETDGHGRGHGEAQNA